MYACARYRRGRAGARCVRDRRPVKSGRARPGVPLKITLGRVREQKKKKIIFSNPPDAVCVRHRSVSAVCAGYRMFDTRDFVAVKGHARDLRGTLGARKFYVSIEKRAENSRSGFFSARTVPSVNCLGYETQRRV